MYIPKYFEVSDVPKLVSFIRDNSFGILFSQNDGLPFATHLPLLIEQTAEGDWQLTGHMARSNPHHAYITSQGAPVLAVFQGPHAYISPSWYEEPNTVPTWNYVAVHVYGEFAAIMDEEELAAMMKRTIDRYESSMPEPWTTELGNGFNRQLMQAIVGFKIRVTRFEGKWKLSQNHSDERRQKVIAALRQQGYPDAEKIAELMYNIGK
ncbi:FMN-binding negative transcriptional regulator [Paenibacillus ginsengarvi]|uniref:FMN-binding negative transcriptional regulator n=1 Tax=Paenibacillus ginsengarvi TaxID=400777 RepID=A0A3B0BAI6_9BACL|nr:FMN-binding negative transcriptional regulator [Paenibacillus ginsengarvi]RKN70060.1 FMN-binding negative transcriptional regulator [Paenibacillus ginsengarvi]